MNVGTTEITRHLRSFEINPKPNVRRLIEDVESEMTKRAQDEDSGTYRFVMSRQTFKDRGLKACRAFSKLTVCNNGMPGKSFRHLRLAVGFDTQPLHVVTEKKIENRRFLVGANSPGYWLSKLNLKGSEHNVDYSLQSVDKMIFKQDGDFLVPVKLNRKQTREVAIPPAETTAIHGLAICANRVLHANTDSLNGVFEAVYGPGAAA